jgi:lysophospholipase L1-like esterase
MAMSQSVDFTYKSYGLENENENVIQNATSLESFFETLYLQRTLNDRVISIVHIGDSHIQGDYLTALVRRNFQTHFGNAGRGLIVPTRVAGSNDAFNIVTNSSMKWESKRCSQPDLLLPIGIGATTIRTNLPGVKLNVYLNDLWMDYSFDAISLFYQKDVTSFQFSVQDTLGRELAVIGPFTEEPFKNYSRIKISERLTSVSLQTIKNTSDQNQATIFGLSLENSRNGILYHAIGANGAKYVHYLSSAFFSQQTAALRPQLFIISLGTNEAISYPYMDKKLTEEIDSLVSALKAYNPKASFILVTPPDAFRKKNKANPGIQIVRQQIIAYAVENGLAFYDMFKACGGEGSALEWRKKGLLRNDGVHFTKDGYAYQGNLLFNALMKGFNQYVPLRHP